MSVEQQHTQVAACTARMAVLPRRATAKTSLNSTQAILEADVYTGQLVSPVVTCRSGQDSLR